MTKLVNRISLVVFIGVLLISWLTYHEEMEIGIPYLNVVFLSTAIFMGVLLFLKANYRWQALFLVKKAKNYFDISTKGLKKATVYEAINIGFYALVSFVLLTFIQEGTIIGIVILFYVVEGVLNVSQNLIGIKYRTVVQENVITIATNYITIIPLNEITKIESNHRDIRFINSNNNTYLLDIDTIKKEQHEDFINQIKSIALKKEIYFDVAFERDDIHHG